MANKGRRKTSAQAYGKRRKAKSAPKKRKTSTQAYGNRKRKTSAQAYGKRR